jgi:hypothetical protein
MSRYRRGRNEDLYLCDFIARIAAQLTRSARARASAPAFRNLRLKYAVADLQRPLLQAEPVHPRLDLKADQVEDVMAYFKSLEQ